MKALTEKLAEIYWFFYFHPPKIEPAHRPIEWVHNKQRRPNAQNIEVHISNELKRATKQMKPETRNIPN